MRARFEGEGFYDNAHRWQRKPHLRTRGMGPTPWTQCWGMFPWHRAPGLAIGSGFHGANPPCPGGPLQVAAAANRFGSGYYRDGTGRQTGIRVYVGLHTVCVQGHRKTSSISAPSGDDSFTPIRIRDFPGALEAWRNRWCSAFTRLGGKALEGRRRSARGSSRGPHIYPRWNSFSLEDCKRHRPCRRIR